MNLRLLRCVGNYGGKRGKAEARELPSSYAESSAEKDEALNLKGFPYIPSQYLR